MNPESQIVTHQPNEFVKASTALSQQLGLDPRSMIDAIKSQFFKGKEASDSQLAVVVSIARELKLNPLIPGQLYPYPDRSGSVTVMIGPDGIYTMLANNPDIVAQKDGGPAYYVEHSVENGKDVCTGYINHRTKGLLKKVIWVDEWVVSSNPNWTSRRHHMAEIRALKQAARMVIHGIPADNDDRVLGEMLNITPEEESPAPTRPAPPPREAKGAAAVRNNTRAKPAEVVIPAEDPKIVTPEPVAVVPEPTPPEPAPEAPKVESRATTPAPESRAFLTDGETLETEVTVMEVKPYMPMVPGADTISRPTASVSATVKGGFVGTIYHIGGATLDEAQSKLHSDLLKQVTPTPLSIWAVGTVLRVKLLGKKNAAGRVLPRVVEASGVNQAGEDDV